MTWPKFLRERPDWLWIALLGLALQTMWAWRLPHPSYFDAYYYATNGQRLADGYGFTEQIIWQFLDDPQGLPTPSHSYWMPLPSLLAAVGYKLWPSFRGMQLPFWLLAGLLPLLSYGISWRLLGTRWQALTAALFTASGGFYNTFWSQPSTFAPIAWLGGGCLWALGTAVSTNKQRHWLLAGLLAGLAHLTRADGVLFLLVGLWVWLWGLWKQRARRRGDDGNSAESGVPLLSRSYDINQSLIPNLQSPISLLIGYLLIMSPWFWRNWQVLGRPLPTSGTQTIFLTRYDDLFAYGRSFTLSSYLAWGWDNILWSKLVALGQAGQLFAAVACLIFLTPLVLWGWWWLGWKEKRPFLRPFSWYTAVLFTVMILLFTFPAGRGSLLHSSAAIWPWLMVLAAAGIGFAVDWRSSRWPHPNPEQMKRIYAGMFVAVALVMTLAIGWLRTPERGYVDLFEQVAGLLPETAVVMVGNAPGFYYHTGFPAITVPNEPPEVLLAVAQRYGVTHLLLDKDTPLPLRGVYQGEVAAGFELVASLETVNLYRVRQ